MDLTCPFCHAPNVNCALLSHVCDGGAWTIMCMKCQLAAILENGELRSPEPGEYPAMVNAPGFSLAIHAFGMGGMPIRA